MEEIKNEPRVDVGIIFEPEIRFILHGQYIFNGTKCVGEHIVNYFNGQIKWDEHLYNEILLIPINERDSYVELCDVTIGIDFHWERKENQGFKGALKIIVEDDKLTAINNVLIEDYLLSVISSEMSAMSSKELLKAHAVISRSWVMRSLTPTLSQGEGRGEGLVWYDNEDHLNYDVCADDHCQRYQGINRVISNVVKEAVEETRGQVLTYHNNICDTRFSKCCGGAFEEFQNCWENNYHPYLTRQRDYKEITYLPDLCKEDEANKWIRSKPEAFCNTSDQRILSQVLNNYDQTTTDFYRWQVCYTQTELSDLIKRRTGIDFGLIQALTPIERGTSGRIIRLEIEGTKETMIIGKELFIRRALSNSHLYSSAFVVDRVDDQFILTGAGWGHGVGLCQIGAAVMADKGYKYDEILAHYYPNSQLGASPQPSPEGRGKDAKRE